MDLDPISPELALIDPTLARQGEHVMIDPLEPPRGDGEPRTFDLPSLETLLFEVGLISPDQLGELIRDSVVSGRPVGAMALERGYVTPDAMRGLLAQAAANSSPLESVEENGAQAAYPIAFIEPISEVVEGWGHMPMPSTSEPFVPMPADALAPVELTPAAEELTPAADTSAQHAFTLMVRLQSGERMAIETAPSFEKAAELATALAARFATSSDWPLVGGRCIRPETIVSVDIEQAPDA